MAKALAPKLPAQCKATDHSFVSVEVTPLVQHQYSQLGGGTIGIGQATSRSFKIFCSKCGEVRFI